MNKTLFLAVFLTSLLVVFSTLVRNKNVKGSTSRIEVCHFKNDGSYNIVTVSEKAVPALLEQGDILAGVAGDPISGMDEGYYYTGACEYEFIRSAKITSPEAGGRYFVGNELTFAATLWDKDKDDGVSWAIRKGTCDSSQEALYGNIDGLSDDYDWDGKYFSSEVNTADWELDDYCFVFRPEGSDEDTEIRETVMFTMAYACQGFEDTEGCWHLGKEDQDCTAVCTQFGGVVPVNCNFSEKQGYNALVTHFFPDATYEGEGFVGIGCRTDDEGNEWTYTSAGENSTCGLSASNVKNVCPCAF